MNRRRQHLLGLALLGFALLVLPHDAPSASQPAAPILVRMPAAAYQALRASTSPHILGATKQMLDYGSFVWIELEAASLSALQEIGLPIEVHQEPYTLQKGWINGS